MFNVATNRALPILAGLVLSAAAGCGELLNPTFLEALSSTGSAASLPGEAPSILVEVNNQTGRTIEFRLTWREADDNIAERIRVLVAGDKFAESVICPVTALTLGDIGDLTETGAVVRLGNGTAADPIVEVEPFGVLLQRDIHYGCGDSITFSVQTSAVTLSGYQVVAFIRRAP